jgi:hypothetical protein
MYICIYICICIHKRITIPCWDVQFGWGQYIYIYVYIYMNFELILIKLEIVTLFTLLICWLKKNKPNINWSVTHTADVVKRYAAAAHMNESLSIHLVRICCRETYSCSLIKTDYKYCRCSEDVRRSSTHEWITFHTLGTSLLQERKKHTPVRMLYSCTYERNILLYACYSCTYVILLYVWKKHTPVRMLYSCTYERNILLYAIEKPHKN